MKLLPCPLPSAQHDWPALTRQFDWIRAMKDCPQDPIHHAEGDVWIHVNLVCEALLQLPEWQSLPEAQREIVYAAALLHDVSKPACTRVEDGRITARGHSQQGAIQARRILWEHGADIQAREQVCALVRYHQIPFYLIERPDAQRMALRISQQTRCGHLAILAKADALGRICQDQQGLLLKIGLFEELCREQACLNQAWKFPSPLSRFEYFRREGRDPSYHVHETPSFEVILMAGLPGSGKDTWLAQHAPSLPVISLDDIREELGAPPTGNQGVVIQAAKERARTYLRTRTSFAWNATNLTRDIRTQLIDLFTDYHARVKIIHIEAPAHSLFHRVDKRERQVPHPAIKRMLERWDIPDPTEAPVVEWWLNKDSFELQAGFS
ncbi:MAG: AAA family ATPase [Acidobacteria bacterium]|nr:AAA family ATPase [Acidobacteriota bacterium]